MVAKKKVGLFLPVQLADTLDELTSRVGKKQKWLIVGAALIRLLQTDEQAQNELIRQVKIADLPGGSFEELITAARQIGATAADTTNRPDRSIDRAAEFQQLVAIDEPTPKRSTVPKPPTRNRPASSKS